MMPNVGEKFQFRAPIVFLVPFSLLRRATGGPKPSRCLDRVNEPRSLDAVRLQGATSVKSSYGAP